MGSVPANNKLAGPHPLYSVYGGIEPAFQLALFCRCNSGPIHFDFALAGLSKSSEGGVLALFIIQTLLRQILSES